MYTQSANLCHDLSVKPQRHTGPGDPVQYEESRPMLIGAQFGLCFRTLWNATPVPDTIADGRRLKHAKLTRLFSAQTRRSVRANEEIIP
jgi:hypothetical protein